MNKQIQLFRAGQPNVRVYIHPDFYDGVTVVWPYKNGYSGLSQDGRICEHFVSTEYPSPYVNPVDFGRFGNILGKKVRWENLPESVKTQILYLFPLVWDLNLSNV